MIRRDDGNDWLLIHQVDHAHLAADVAEVWGNAETPSLPVPELLVPAIRHHDDGWQRWSLSPGIDPQSGWPRNFTEMSMRDATAIWTESIDVCTGIVPGDANVSTAGDPASALGGIWGSRHFCWLARQARNRRTGHDDDRIALDRFLAAQRQVQTRLKRQVSGPQSELPLEERIEFGFRWLQFFDELSLWLCCARRTEPYELHAPDGSIIELIPRSPQCVLLEPFPLAVDQRELSVPARRLAVQRFPDDAAFQQAEALAPAERLVWLLCRA